MYNNEGTDVIVCPFCDREQEQEIEFHDGDGFVVKCEECQDDFFVEAHVKFVFYSSHIIDVEFKEILEEEKDDGDE